MNSHKNLHILTSDGTSTLYSEKYRAHYHSIHGSYTEAKHIFISAGLAQSQAQPIKVLEVGFGTGLNAALTAYWALENSKPVIYQTLELHPLSSENLTLLNYTQTLQPETATLWKNICAAQWEKEVLINPYFTIHKVATDFVQWIPKDSFDVVYFDAFSPTDQPEMWEENQLKKIYDAMNEQGILVTYSIKGTVKRALQNIGFSTERLDGPPGKKHFLRAIKTT